jgi:hypothetical protein
MSLTRVIRALVLLLPAAVLPAPARADGCANCGTCGCCPPGICCPKTVFCRIRPPCIRWKCTCPKPVCDPCNLDHYGYYPTCWHAWPFPPDYSCCHQPPNAVLADQMLSQPLVTTTTPDTTSEALPVPRKLNGPPELER